MISTALDAVKNPGSVVTFADYKIGRDVLGRSNKLSSSLTGDLAIERSKFRQTDGERSDSREARTLRESGVVELGRPYERSTVETVKTRFDEIIETGAYTYTHGTPSRDYSFGIDSSTFDFAENLPEVAEFVTPELLDVLSGYYGTWVKPVRVNMWRNHHVPPEVVESSEVFSNYWHTDPHTTDHLKLFVYLTDVGEDHGPFHTVSRDDSLRITNNYKRSRDGVPHGRVESEASEIIRFTGPAGSTGVCNTSTNLHRAGVPKEGEYRDLLQMVFAPASKPLDDEWLEDRSSYSFDGSDHNGFGRLLRY